MTEAEVLARHRAVWEARPELRQVYREWFTRLLAPWKAWIPWSRWGRARAS